ncbi:hypothetical protein ABZP36_029519, partial [Zizania latifolia]
EVDNFFKGHGVGDFTFSRGKLIRPFDEDVGTSELRYVQMAVTTYNTSIPVEKKYEQVSLVWNSRDEHSKNSEKLSLLSE